MAHTRLFRKIQMTDKRRAEASRFMREFNISTEEMISEQSYASRKETLELLLTYIDDAVNTNGSLDERETFPLLTKKARSMINALHRIVLFHEYYNPIEDSEITTNRRKLFQCFYYKTFDVLYHFCSIDASNIGLLLRKIDEFEPLANGIIQTLSPANKNCIYHINNFVLSLVWAAIAASGILLLLACTPLVSCIGATVGGLAVGAPTTIGGIIGTAALGSITTAIGLFPLSFNIQLAMGYQANQVTALKQGIIRLRA